MTSEREERFATELLAAAAETLETAERGLSDLLDAGRPEAWLPGVRNLIVFGRSVTNLLQNLRTPLGAAFDEWYGPIQTAAAGDELLKGFDRLRAEIVTAGSVPIGDSSIHMERLDTRELASLMHNPPPGARTFFMRDHRGGSGWEVALPDGTTEKYYVALRADVGATTRLRLENTPATHGGELLADTSVEALSQHYIEYLRRLVHDAIDRFGA